MNIRLGLYEIFSRIVPGGVYIVAIGQLLTILGLVKVDLQILNSLSFIASLALIVIAYILGGALDNLALILYRLFNRPGFSARTFAEFKKKHQDRWVIDFEDDDWKVLLAYIRTKNLELASEIDRHNAISIMSRNIGSGLILIAGNILVQFLISHNSINLFLCATILILATLIFREAIKFRAWFYDGIYETVLAYRIDLEQSIRPVKTPSNQSKRMKKDEY
jgi:hypothetical protein